MNKKITLWIVGILIAFNVSAQNIETYYISAPRFVRPLLEKWILEYKKVEPKINFQLINNTDKNEEKTLRLVLNDKGNGEVQEENVIYFGQYAILPITSSNSEAAKLLSNKKMNEKKIKELFFVKNKLSEEKSDKNIERLMVYSGNGELSVANTFASFFDQDAANFRGIRISGDDVFLNTAINKQPLAVSFNALSNIYDLNTRKLKDDVSILSLDLKKNQESSFYSIDELIKLLETNVISEIPVHKIGISYTGKSQTVNIFFGWIISSGNNYNHEYGLLKLSEKDLASQKSKLNLGDIAKK